MGDQVTERIHAVVSTPSQAIQDAMAERDAWIAMRKEGVGASDVAAILGENPYSSAYEVWAKKCGLLDDNWDDNEKQHWGRILEPEIAREYSRRSGNEVIDHGAHATSHHPSNKRLYATVDREINGSDHGAGSLECKNTREYFQDEWEAGGPMMYRLQLQTQLEVMGWDWGALAVLIGGHTFMSIEMDRDKELGELILEEVDEFWKLVESRTPPPNDGTPATRRVLEQLHPRDSGETIVLPRETLPHFERWEDAKKRIRDAYREKESCEAYLFEAIGDATWAQIPDGRKLQWKIQQKKEYTVKPSESRVLRCVKGARR